MQRLQRQIPFLHESGGYSGEVIIPYKEWNFSHESGGDSDCKIADQQQRTLLHVSGGIFCPQAGDDLNLQSVYQGVYPYDKHVFGKFMFYRD